MKKNKSIIIQIVILIVIIAIIFKIVHKDKEFNSAEDILKKSKTGEYQLEYYPSGRVKDFDDQGPYGYNLEDRSYMYTIKTELEELDEYNEKELNSWDDESISKFLQDTQYFGTMIS